jgi:hypothetical protein
VIETERDLSDDEIVRMPMAIINQQYSNVHSSRDSLNELDGVQESGSIPQ